MLGKPNYSIDLPSGQHQIHMHGSSDRTILTGGYLKQNKPSAPVGGSITNTYMNGYECAMVDFVCSQAGWNTTNYKKQ